MTRRSIFSALAGAAAVPAAKGVMSLRPNKKVYAVRLTWQTQQRYGPRYPWTQWSEPVVGNWVVVDDLASCAKAYNGFSYRVRYVRKEVIEIPGGLPA